MILYSLEDAVKLLQKLEEKKIHYSLERYLHDSISLKIVVPGERWEVDINKSGEIQVEIFKSSGDIYSADMLNELFERFSDEGALTLEVVL